MNRIAIILLLLVAQFLVSSTHVYGDEWSVSELKYRVQVIVKTPGINGSVENLLIPLHLTSDIIDFSKTSPSGDDIVVTSIDGEIIPYYVEYWNISENRGLIWIKPPVYNGSIKLYIYYGLKAEGKTVPESPSPWQGYYLVLAFNQREIFYVKGKPFIHDLSPSNHTAKIVGPGYAIIDSPTGQAVELDGKNAWINVLNTTFYNWTSITIEALLYLYDKQATYGTHRDLAYGNYIDAPFASIYLLYGENRTNPSISFYFNTWRPGIGLREYVVNLTKYRGGWVYLVIVYDNSTREYKVYVNGEKIRNKIIPEDELTILDVNPRKWDPYGTRYLSLGLGANNLGFERSRVAYDFLRISSNRVPSDEWVKAEYNAITNTSLKLISLEEHSEPLPMSISVPKTLMFGVALVLIVSIIYMVYGRRGKT